MPVPLGRYRSPGAEQRTLDFERSRAWALSTFLGPYLGFLRRLQPEATPRIGQPGLLPPMLRREGAFARPEVGLTSLLKPSQQAHYAENMGPEGVRLALASATAPPGPETGPMDVLRGVGRALEWEREQVQPYTKPVFRKAGEAATRGVLDTPWVLRKAGVPSTPWGERAGEIGGEVAATAGGELALPSNLIPLPVIDPLVGRALGLAFKVGQRVSRPVAERLAMRLGRLAADPAADAATRTAARRTETELRRLVAERPVAGAAEEATRAGVPQPTVPTERGYAAFEGEGYGPAPLVERGTSGAEQALNLKEQTLLRPGRATQVPGVKQVLSGVNPSVSMDRRVLVSHNAQQAVASTLETEFAAQREPVVRALQEAWDAAPPTYVGPKNNALKNTIKDWADNPEFYSDVSRPLRAAAEQYDAVSNAILNRTRGEFNVEVGRYTSGKDKSFYLPTVAARDSVDDALRKVAEGYTTASIGHRTGVTRTRLYEGAFQRAQRNPGFVAETDLAELTALHDRALARLGGNETFRLGAGGKTRLEVMQELHPNLYNQMMAVRQRLTNLRATAGRLTERTRTAIDDFLANPEASLADAADALDVTVTRGRDKGLDIKGINAEIKGVRQEIRRLRPAWENANIEPYVLNRKTFRYHSPEASSAIDKILLTKMPMGEGLVAAIDEIRLTAFAADVSPLTIQGMLGLLSDPVTGARSLPGIGATLGSPEHLLEVARAEPEMVRRFTMATGRPFGEIGSEFVQRARGIERVPVVGRELNRRLMAAVEFIRYKQWKTDTMLVEKLGGATPEVADAEAANALSKIIPALNPAERGASVLQAKLERLPVISTSFIGGPATVIKDAAAGLVKLAMPNALGPAARWQGLAGREQLAILHLSALTGTIATAAVGSHIASGWSPEEALKATLDPTSPRFLSIAFGRSRRIPVGGPLRSTLRAFVPRKVGEKGGVPIYMPFAGVPDWLQGKVTPGLRMPVDIVRNKDYFGGKITTGSFPENILRTIWYAANNILPLGLAEPSEAVRRGEVEPTDIGALAERGGAQLGGVDLRETSPWERVQWARRAGMEQMGFGDYPGGWDQFKADHPAEAAQIDQMTSVQEPMTLLGERAQPTEESRAFDVVEELRGEATTQQEADDSRLDAGTMTGDTWKERYRDRQRTLYDKKEAIFEFAGLEFDEKEPTAGTPGAALVDFFNVNIDDYTDKQTGEVDWDGFFGAREKALARLSPSERRKLEREVIHKFDTPGVREFRLAQEAVDKLFAIPKYRDLTLAQGEEVDRLIYEVVPLIQLDFERQRGVSLERSIAVGMIIKEGVVKDPEIKRFLLRHFYASPYARRTSYLTKVEPENPERDQWIIRHQELLAKFYPELVQSLLSREQEAELLAPAYERLAVAR